MEGKTCTTCQIWKAYSEFHKFKRMKDGYEIYCKQCRKDYYKKKEFYVSKGYPKGVKRGINPFEIKIINEQAIEGKHCKKCNEWKAKNQYHKFARLTGGHEIYCKTCRVEMLRNYHNTERGKQVAYLSSLKRRSRKNNVKLKLHERLYILNRDKWTCQECGIKVHDKNLGRKQSPDKAHIDHIISLDDGGPSEPTNFQVLCRTCNLRKKNKSPKQMILF